MKYNIVIFLRVKTYNSNNLKPNFRCNKLIKFNIVIILRYRSLKLNNKVINLLVIAFNNIKLRTPFVNYKLHKFDKVIISSNP